MSKKEATVHQKEDQDMPKNPPPPPTPKGPPEPTPESLVAKAVPFHPSIEKQRIIPLWDKKHFRVNHYSLTTFLITKSFFVSIEDGKVDVQQEVSTPLKKEDRY